MTHYRMQDRVPVGIILAKNSRTGSLDELKTYNENVIYLNDGNEFQIRLFNPLQQKIGVLIGLNGEFSQSYLVLNPGQDVTIDRFIDSQKKMLFETYKYDSSNQAAQNAVVKNGIIEIKFFKEFVPITYSTVNSFIGNVPLYNDTSGGNVFLNCTTNTVSGNFTQTGTFSTNSLNINSVDNTSNLEFKSEEPQKSYMKRSKDALKETGRVSRGSKSSQLFEKVDAQFEYFPFHQIVYQLKPFSEKEETIEIREYCTDCGYRLRNGKWNYCPKCGNKI